MSPQTNGICERFHKAIPVPQEHEFHISPDATHYYTSGKTYLYRTFPFGIASLIACVLAVIIPVALLLIPALRTIPAIYRWRMEYRINKWYRAFMDLERESSTDSADLIRRAESLRRLAHIEKSVSKMGVPAKFGNLLYGLREHISFVRSILLSQHSDDLSEANLATNDHGKQGLE